MRGDYYYYERRYESIEEELIEILDYIEIHPRFDNHCYQIGSSKLMDFCIKVGTEIETIFRIIIKSSDFNDVEDIDNKRQNQNINIYRELIEPIYQISTRQLRINHIDRIIKPFRVFSRGENPEWFQIYSSQKHNKLILIEQWNIKHSLCALGGLLVLIERHPQDTQAYPRASNLSQKILTIL